MNLPKEPEYDFSLLYYEMAMFYINQYDIDEDETVFSGWYLDSKFNLEFSKYPTSDITLYAKFSAPIFINFDLGEGYGLYGNLDGEFVVQFEKIYYYEATFSDWLANKTLYVKAPAGSEFEGWYADSERTIPYNATEWPTQSVTLYAKYIERSN